MRSESARLFVKSTSLENFKYHDYLDIPLTKPFAEKLTIESIDTPIVAVIRFKKNLVTLSVYERMALPAKDEHRLMLRGRYLQEKGQPIWPDKDDEGHFEMESSSDFDESSQPLKNVIEGFLDILLPNFARLNQFLSVFSTSRFQPFAGDTYFLYNFIEFSDGEGDAFALFEFREGEEIPKKIMRIREDETFVVQPYLNTGEKIKTLSGDAYEYNELFKYIDDDYEALIEKRREEARSIQKELIKLLKTENLTIPPSPDMQKKMTALTEKRDDLMDFFTFDKRIPMYAEDEAACFVMENNLPSRYIGWYMSVRCAQEEKLDNLGTYYQKERDEYYKTLNAEEKKEFDKVRLSVESQMKPMFDGLNDTM